jgi:hypothetical protein
MSYAKEKAEELYNKYYQLCADSSSPENIAKQCSLITINEMLDFRNALFINEGSLIHQHLLDVKKEIELL